MTERARRFVFSAETRGIEKEICRGCGKVQVADLFLSFRSSKGSRIRVSPFCFRCDRRNWIANLLPVGKNGKRECPVCTNHFKADDYYPTVSHWDDYHQRWCPGGDPNGGKPPRGGSAWASSAGLPTLGKRR